MALLQRTVYIVYNGEMVMIFDSYIVHCRIHKMHLLLCLERQLPRHYLARVIRKTKFCSQGLLSPSGYHLRSSADILRVPHQYV